MRHEPASQFAELWAVPEEGAIDVTIVMPCLNEAECLPHCIANAREALQRIDREYGLTGEIVVADNGSTDGSQAIATQLGARVVPVAERGYGAALIGGSRAAHGKYVLMADADGSYDFTDGVAMIGELEAGAELVMGNRFGGGIERGAMPALHRYIGNPVLSALARWLHKAPISDFHCGIRAFTRDAFVKMGARSPGMEFASEMVINAQRAGLDIREVPIRLHPDIRSRPPHLRSFRDGWRHLRLIIAHAPDTMYLIPGLVLLVAGALGLGALALGPVRVGGIYFGIHFVALCSMATLIGLSAILLGALAKVAIAIYHPSSRGRVVPWLKRGRPLEWLVGGGSLLAFGGFAADALLALKWIFVGGRMELSVHLSFAITTACVAGVMMALSGFVLKLLLDSVDETHGL
ncbi:MAG: glycosyltransferase family 2 protein [Bacillota bacterium]